MERVDSVGPITEAEWEALEDPPGGRYEIIDGCLVVSPSPNELHNRYLAHLPHILEAALLDADNPAFAGYVVTFDVEWRTLGAEYVAQAPRGDIVVGPPTHREKRIHVERPLLVGEVWSHQTASSEKKKRRDMWAGRGVLHYWELSLNDPFDERDATISVYDFTANAKFPIMSATGSETLMVNEPFPVSIRPDQILGWVEYQVSMAREQAQLAAQQRHAAEQRADAAEQRADAAEQRAEDEAQQRHAAEQRADAAERALQALRHQTG